MEIESLTPRSKTVLARAHTIASEFHCDYIGTEHLFMALLEKDEGLVNGLLEAAGFDRSQILERVKQEYRKLSVLNSKAPTSTEREAMIKVLESAVARLRQL